MNRILVRIDRYFKYPEIMRQTPKGEGVWGNLVFTEEKISECDYLVILDHPGSDIKVKVNPDNIDSISWARNTILEKYQLFPFLNPFIMSNEYSQGVRKKHIKREVSIKGGSKYFDNIPIYIKQRKYLKNLKQRINNIIK